MTTILIILYIIPCLILLWHFLTKKYVNPYTFTIIFGKKGAGKSCSMQQDLIKHNKRGWHCYADSNTHLPFVKTVDCRRLYSYDFPKRSLICIDEVNLLWDNRDFKNFDKRILEWFRLQRHKRVKVIAYSQTFDTDLKLRNLSDYVCLQKKFLRTYSIRRKYVKTPRILTAEEARDHSKIVDDFVKVPWYFGGLQFTYIPKYIKHYDSHCKSIRATVPIPPPAPEGQLAGDQTSVPEPAGSGSKASSRRGSRVPSLKKRCSDLLKRFVKRS